MAVPYTFGSATTSIPLSQLDSNFATTITLGNTAIQLGNTVTTLNNMTFANATVSSGNVTVSNVTASNVVLSGSTSGTTTLQATAVAGTTTATLPAATGTVMVSGNMPACHVYLSADQSVSSATLTKIAFDTKIYDTATCFNTSTNRFTPTVAGYYQVSCGVDYSNSTSGITRVNLCIYKNGSQLFHGPDFQNSGTLSQNMSGLVYCNGSTDYIEGWGSVNATGPKFTGGYGGIYTYFTCSMVRGA